MIAHWGSYYQCQPCKEKSLEFSWDCTHKDIKKLLKSAWIFEYALHDAVTYRKLLGNTHKISPTARLIEWKDSTRAQFMTCSSMHLVHLIHLAKFQYTRNYL